MKRFVAENVLKKKVERETKEKVEQTPQHRIELKREEPENQKKMAEEDFENKKLVPVLKEAFDLVNEIETKRKVAEKEIKKIRNATFNKDTGKRKMLDSF